MFTSKHHKNGVFYVRKKLPYQQYNNNWLSLIKKLVDFMTWIEMKKTEIKQRISRCWLQRESRKTALSLAEPASGEPGAECPERRASDAERRAPGPVLIRNAPLRQYPDPQQRAQSLFILICIYLLFFFWFVLLLLFHCWKIHSFITRVYYSINFNSVTCRTVQWISEPISPTQNPFLLFSLIQLS